jgi:hypothetical protein
MEQKNPEKNKKDKLQLNENNQKETSEFHGEKYKKKSEYPNFLLKLYQILENKDYKDIIEWSDDGKYFIVKNLHDFTENVLPKYYKHNNYSSFIRQLNMYDFHKRKGNPNEHIFEHVYFIKNRKDLLKLIKRKSKKETNTNYNNINNNNFGNINDNKILYPYNNNTNFINNYNNNRYFPTNKKELLPFYPNQPYINNNINNINGIKSVFKNDRKSSFSIDDNLSLNNNSENNSYILNKKIPLLPMGNSIPMINNNTNSNNINNNNININSNNINNNINISNEKEEKKITKKNLQNLLSYLMHSVDQNTETQKQLEQKIEMLSNQNEEFISQNKKILQEIVTKNEYNQRLEAVICFILEMIISKSKMKNNQELKNLFISNESNLSKANLFNNNPGSILEPYQTFLNKYYERAKNGDLPKFNNNNILLEDDNNKYYIPINNYEQNINQINTENLKKNLIGNGTEDNLGVNNNNYPIVISNKRKRSSSFNSILSNLSRGSNVYFNNNKLLKSEEDEKKEVEKDKKNEINENEENNIIKRKDSLSSWNDNNKDVFDLDISQDENKSFLNGYNKDLLNNSQTSFNDVYGNNNISFSDINN